MREIVCQFFDMSKGALVQSMGLEDLFVLFRGMGTMVWDLTIGDVVSYRPHVKAGHDGKSEDLPEFSMSSTDVILVGDAAGRIDGVPYAGAAAEFGLVIEQAAYLKRKIIDEIDNVIGKIIVIADAQNQYIAVLTPELLTRKLLRCLGEEQARMQAVMDTVGEAVCIIDDHDRVVTWNHRAEALYGIAAQEILGLPIEQFFSNLVLTKVIKNRQQVRDTYHKPCSGTHVLINATPVRLGEKIIGGACAERDITELVYLNQELSKASSQVQTLKQKIDKMSLQQPDPFAVVYGHSCGIREAIAIAKRVSATNVPVLLRGESGTGKEVFARAIHAASQRSGPFVEINCGAIPASLFESELFGYQSGAFTGADRKGKPGLFEVAHGGTVFLDEIGELPLEMQVKLLRVLQEKSFYRIGGGQPVRVDIRIIAATHRNLEEMIKQRHFRDDLYYRLNVVSLELPPLRERKEDVPELVYRAIQLFSAQHAKEINKVDPAVMAVFLDYAWPGNVRELYNMVERLFILAEGDVIGGEALPANLRLVSTTVNQRIAVSTPETDLSTATMCIERDIILRVLKEVKYNKSAAAKKLGIPRSTLYYKIDQLGLETCQKIDGT
jgi:PAS domain S-box-containing protein